MMPDLMPMRAVIQCKAKMQLLALDPFKELEETLFVDIALTFFRSHVYTYWCEQCARGEDPGFAEDEMAKAIAQSYQQVIEQRSLVLVQQLNALL